MAAVPYTFGYSNTTAVERQPVFSKDIWLNAGLLGQVTPCGTYVNAATAATAGAPTVVGQYYQYTCSQLSLMVPGNFGNGTSFKPTLTDGSGKIIPYNNSMWVADSDLQVIQFNGNPRKLGYNPQFTLQYYQYAGNTGTNLIGQSAGGYPLLATNIASPQTLVAVQGTTNVVITQNTTGTTQQVLSYDLGPTVTINNLNVNGTLIAASSIISVREIVVGPSIYDSTLTVCGDLTTLSAIITKGPLSVSGPTYLSTLYTASNVTMGGNVGVSGQLNTVGGIQVSGPANFGSTVNVSGALTISSATNLLSTLYTASNAIMGGNVGVSGQLNTVGGIQVSGPANFGSTVNVSGALTISNATSLLSTLYTASNATMGGNVGVSGVMTAISGITLSNVLTVVNGPGSVNQYLTSSGPGEAPQWTSAPFGNYLPLAGGTVTGSTTFNQNVTVCGSLSLTNEDPNSLLLVTPSALFTGQTTLSGNTVIGGGGLTFFAGGLATLPDFGKGSPYGLPGQFLKSNGITNSIGNPPEWTTINNLNSLTICGTLTVSGGPTDLLTLYTASNAIMGGSATVCGALTVSGALTVNSSATIRGNVTVSGPTAVNMTMVNTAAFPGTMTLSQTNLVIQGSAANPTYLKLSNTALLDYYDNGGTPGQSLNSLGASGVVWTTNTTYTKDVSGIAVFGPAAVSGPLLGTDSVIIGSTAKPTGSYNVAIGSLAASGLTTGESNVAIGYNAAYNTTTGTNNVAVGSGTLYQSTIGQNNTAIGNLAGFNITGSDNTALGYQAGAAVNIPGAQNTIIGAYSQLPNPAGNRQIVLGTSGETTYIPGGISLLGALSYHVLTEQLTTAQAQITYFTSASPAGWPQYFVLNDSNPPTTITLPTPSTAFKGVPAYFRNMYSQDISVTGSVYPINQGFTTGTATISAYLSAGFVCDASNGWIQVY